MNTSVLTKRLAERVVDNNPLPVLPELARDITDMATVLDKVAVPSPDITHKCSVTGEMIVLRPEDIGKQKVFDPTLMREVDAVLRPDYESLRREAVPIVCLSCKAVHAWRKPGVVSGYILAAGRPVHTPVCPTCLTEYLTLAARGIEVSFPILELKAAECQDKGVDFKEYMRKWKANLEHNKQEAQVNTKTHTNGQTDQTQG